MFVVLLQAFCGGKKKGVGFQAGGSGTASWQHTRAPMSRRTSSSSQLTI
jgi:hypothetical protein